MGVQRRNAFISLFLIEHDGVGVAVNLMAQAEVTRPLVQILVVFVDIQMINLKTEVGKVSM